MATYSSYQNTKQVYANIRGPKKGEIWTSPDTGNQYTCIFDAKDAIGCFIWKMTYAAPDNPTGYKKGQYVTHTGKGFTYFGISRELEPGSLSLSPEEKGLLIEVLDDATEDLEDDHPLQALYSRICNQP